MPVTPDRFDAAKRHIQELLDADPTLTVDEVRDKLNSFPSDVLSRAYAAVKRARAEPELAGMREALDEGGIRLPPQVATFPTPVPPARTYPSDEGYAPATFIQAFERLAAAYERRVKPGTREVYYQHLVNEEHCTLDECIAAVPILLRTQGTWPRISDWFQAVITVRQQRARRTGGGQPEPRVDEAGNALFACVMCRDAGWRPACGCPVGDLEAGYCLKHPREENGLTYRPRFVRCECARMPA